jgi:hypothetical protein
MLKGTVIEFTQEKGFGKIELEDGTVLNFDASVASHFEIGPGSVGEVHLREIRGRRIITRIDFNGDGD